MVRIIADLRTIFFRNKSKILGKVEKKCLISQYFKGKMEMRSVQIFIDLTLLLYSRLALVLNKFKMLAHFTVSNEWSFC